MKQQQHQQQEQEEKTTFDCGTLHHALLFIKGRLVTR